MTRDDDTNEQSVDLLIAHHQVLVRARPYDDGLAQWGPGNGDQGAVLHPDYLTFDPLPEEAFGAMVHLMLASAFSPDPDAARSIVAPFAVAEPGAVEVASAAESFPVELGLVAGSYDVHFEICEGEDEDAEIYYRFTFVPNASPAAPRFLIDDEWGGEAGQPLCTGMF
ncbi:competence protein ComJ [Microbacterium indicum]|uniref:competence protein ComJ n=1 Tax=Microbacterium indicum TaxID=358100 RepID=UPI0004037A69|nr:competence protein ComJ [Microbacterium indicum]